MDLSFEFRLGIVYGSDVFPSSATLSFLGAPSGGVETGFLFQKYLVVANFRLAGSHPRVPLTGIQNSGEQCVSTRTAS